MTSSVPPSSPPPLRPVVGVGIVIVREVAGTPEVLLIRRGRPPGEGLWNMPGGKQELGETVREAAAREAREETGVEISGLRLIDVVDAFARQSDGAIEHHWTLVDFRADWAGGEVAAGDDAADARWVPLADLDRYGLWAETLRVIRAGAAMNTEAEPLAGKSGVIAI
jgi:ADP-ribose pyrophosphatase YjhB (NUDIX family)